jgi:hypothetical protein
MTMLRSLTSLTATIVVGATLTGCGLVDTGAATAASAASQVEQVRQAKETEARVKKQLDAAYQQAADQRHAAEAESQ